MVRIHESICAACPQYEGGIRGLGDIVEAAARVTGIKAAVAKSGGGCGCNQRRTALNQIAPNPFK